MISGAEDAINNIQIKDIRIINVTKSSNDHDVSYFVQILFWIHIVVSCSVPCQVTEDPGSIFEDSNQEVE